MKKQNPQGTRLINRLNRRETHSSRAALSIVIASALLVSMLWLAMELLLSATGNPALLVAPAELAERTSIVATATIPGALVAVGIGIALLGLWLLAVAVLPGTKPRHIVENARAAVVVDSEVLAAAASRAARTAARMAPEQVTSSVGRDRIEVSVRPTAGRTVDIPAVTAAVDHECSSYGLRRPLAIHATSKQAAS